MPTIVGKQCKIVLESRRGNEEVKITKGKTGCTQPATLSPKYLACFFIDAEHQETGGENRVIQFSSSIPMSASANAGWAANRRQAAAMFG
jgi:hypothetical protein